MMVAGSVEAAVAELGAALEAAADALPLPGAQRGSAEVVTSAAQGLPGSDAAWVGVELAGRGVILVVAVAADATGELDPHVDGARLEPALSAAAGRLGGTPGEATAGQGEDLPDAPLVVAVRLAAGGRHVATVLALAEDPNGAASAASASVFPALDASGPGAGRAGGGRMTQPIAINLLRGVEMNVTVELGRTTMTVRDLLQLVPGSVIELDRAAGSPVDLLVNGTLLARGEVVVIDEEYGIRVSEIVTPVEGD